MSGLRERIVKLADEWTIDCREDSIDMAVACARLALDEAARECERCMRPGKPVDGVYPTWGLAVDCNNAIRSLASHLTDSEGR